MSPGFSLIKRTLFLASLLFLAWSCSKSSFFFVENEGAVMPVTISGNTSSNTFILLLPGGPAGDGQVYRRAFPVFRKYLEPHHQMVYFDQRGGGNCQGTYDTSSLNLYQLAADLDRVIEVIRHRRPKARIVLLGYSYGGALAMTYLVDPDYREKVAGMIGLSGAYDRSLQSEYQDQLIVALLDHWVAQDLLDNYDALEAKYSCLNTPDPALCQSDSIQTQRKVTRLFQTVERANQFPINLTSLGRLLAYSFFSQSNPITSGMNEAQNGTYFQSEFDSLLLSDRIGEIRTPLLLIHGRYDTNVPFLDAQTVFERIGTAFPDKKLVILEQSGHLPMLTEPEPLAEAILAFLRKL